MGLLQGKVAIISGGAAGFGQAIVRQYVAEGAKVVIADLQADLGQGLSTSLGPDKASFVRCDVADGASVAALVREAVAHSGVPDIVVNNAGTTHPNRPVLEVDEATFDRLFAVNVKSILEKFMGVPDTPQNRAKFLATIPLGRLSLPSDVAAAALFLASDAAQFISGVEFPVDAGGRCGTPVAGVRPRRLCAKPFTGSMATQRPNKTMPACHPFC